MPPVPSPPHHPSSLAPAPLPPSFHYQWYTEATRARRTCEKKEDVQLVDMAASMRALLAWSAPSTATAVGSDELSYHGTAHRRTMNFAFDPAPTVVLPSDAKSITLVAPDHVVSAASGSYACSYHALPLADPTNIRYHVVKYGLQYDAANPSVVAGLQHHVNIMACTGAVDGLTDGQAVPCGGGGMVAKCSTTLVTGLNTVLPADRGIPVGKGATMFVVVSRHFYNPAGKTNVVDHGTSFSLTYTAQMRTHEQSMFTLGSTQFSVPPLTYGHTVRSACGPSCTGRLGASNITTVYVHMHGHGKRAAVRLVRDGKELEPVAVLDPWDGSKAPLQVHRELMPGDTLLLDCTYDNDLSTALDYGDGINQEMCFGTCSSIVFTGIRVLVGYF